MNMLYTKRHLNVPDEILSPINSSYQLSVPFPYTICDGGLSSGKQFGQPFHGVTTMTTLSTSESVYKLESSEPPDSIVPGHSEVDREVMVTHSSRSNLQGLFYLAIVTVLLPMMLILGIMITKSGYGTAENNLVYVDDFCYWLEVSRKEFEEFSEADADNIYHGLTVLRKDLELFVAFMIFQYSFALYQESTCIHVDNLRSRLVPLRKKSKLFEDLRKKSFEGATAKYRQTKLVELRRKWEMCEEYINIPVSSSSLSHSAAWLVRCVLRNIKLQQNWDLITTDSKRCISSLKRRTEERSRLSGLIRPYEFPDKLVNKCYILQGSCAIIKNISEMTVNIIYDLTDNNEAPCPTLSLPSVTEEQGQHIQSVFETLIQSPSQTEQVLSLSPGELVVVPAEDNGESLSSHISNLLRLLSLQDKQSPSVQAELDLLMEDIDEISSISSESASSVWSDISSEEPMGETIPAT